MGCGGSKEGKTPDVLEEETVEDAATDARIVFQATIQNPLIHNAARVLESPCRCKLIVNLRRKLLTRVIGSDSVTVDLSCVAALHRHHADPRTVTVVTGGAKYEWVLTFNDTTTAFHFYQMALATNPYNVASTQCVPLHFFQGHFRGVAEAKPKSLMEYIPQNPDGYIFSVVGGSVAQRGEWVDVLRKVSAVGDCEEEWCEEISDDALEGGLCIVLWLSKKHSLYMGSARSEIVSAYPDPDRPATASASSAADAVAQAIAPSVEDAGTPAEGAIPKEVVFTVSAAGEDASTSKKEERTEEAEEEGEPTEEKTVLPTSTMGGVSFTMGATSIGFFASANGCPEVMDQFALGSPWLSSLQFDHTLIVGDLQHLYIGNDDFPQNVNFEACIKGAFAWRSTSCMGKAGCEQLAQGTTEAGKYSIFKLPVAIPSISEPAETDTPFVLAFHNMILTDIPFTRRPVQTVKPAPVVTFSGLFCESSESEPMFGCSSCPVTLVKEEQVSTAKGLVTEQVDQVVKIQTYVADQEYIRSQVLHLTVQDASPGAFVYGSAGFSIAHLCAQKLGISQDFKCIINSNGRYGGHVSGKVMLLRTGQPTPRGSIVTQTVKRAAGEKSAMQKLKAKMSS